MNFDHYFTSLCSSDFLAYNYAMKNADFEIAREKSRDLEACALGFGNEELAKEARELGAVAAGKIAAGSGAGAKSAAPSDATFLARFSATLTQAYGNFDAWPRDVKNAFAKINAARGTKAFIDEAAKAINSLRLSPETYPAFEIGTALLANRGGEFFAAAKALEKSAATGIVSDKTASFAYDFIFGNPENTLLPLYAAGKLGKLVEGFTAIGAETLGLARGATTALKTTTGLATEAPAFVGTGKLVALEKGKQVNFDAVEFFKESFSSGLVFGALKFAGFFAQTGNAFLPATQAGQAAALWNANLTSIFALMGVSGAERLANSELAENKTFADAFIEAAVVHFGLAKMMGSVGLTKLAQERAVLLKLTTGIIDGITKLFIPNFALSAESGTFTGISSHPEYAGRADVNTASRIYPEKICRRREVMIKLYERPEEAAAIEFVNSILKILKTKKHVSVALPPYDTIPAFYSTLVDMFGKELFWSRVNLFIQSDNPASPRQSKGCGLKQKFFYGINALMQENIYTFSGSTMSEVFRKFSGSLDIAVVTSSVEGQVLPSSDASINCRVNLPVRSKSVFFVTSDMAARPAIEQAFSQGEDGQTQIGGLINHTNIVFYLPFIPRKGSNLSTKTANKAPSPQAIATKKRSNNYLKAAEESLLAAQTMQAQGKRIGFKPYYRAIKNVNMNLQAAQKTGKHSDAIKDLWNSLAVLITAEIERPGQSSIKEVNVLIGAVSKLDFSHHVSENVWIEMNRAIYSLKKKCFDALVQATGIQTTAQYIEKKIAAKALTPQVAAQLRKLASEIIKEVEKVIESAKQTGLETTKYEEMVMHIYSLLAQLNSEVK